MSIYSGSQVMIPVAKAAGLSTQMYDLVFTGDASEYTGTFVSVDCEYCAFEKFEVVPFALGVGMERGPLLVWDWIRGAINMDLDYLQPILPLEAVVNQAHSGSLRLTVNGTLTVTDIATPALVKLRAIGVTGKASDSSGIYAHTNNEVWVWVGKFAPFPDPGPPNVIKEAYNCFVCDASPGTGNFWHEAGSEIRTADGGLGTKVCNVLGWTKYFQNVVLVLAGSPAWNAIQFVAQERIGATNPVAAFVTCRLSATTHPTLAHNQMERLSEWKVKATDEKPEIAVETINQTPDTHFIGTGVG